MKIWIQQMMGDTKMGQMQDEQTNTLPVSPGAGCRVTDAGELGGS